MTEMTYGIVAGYDGSPDGAQALRWAAREAQARDTTLTVCLAWMPDQVMLPAEAALSDLSRRRGREILDRGLPYARSVLGPGRVRTELVAEPAALALCERSRTAEMVVVGSRGHGGVAGLRLGSVPWHLAAHGHGRVVIVRGEWRPVNESPGPVVAGVDGSPDSWAAVTFAFEEAALRDVPLVAVCALADSPGLLGGARRMEEAFSHAMTLREKEHHDVTVLRQVAAGAPRPALLAAAAGAQLLVLGARGLGGLRGMTLGSVAQALLHHAPCPVAIVHPSAHQA